MSREFRTYGVDELNELVQSTTPTRVSLILDETAVDFPSTTICAPFARIGEPNP